MKNLFKIHLFTYVLAIIMILMGKFKIYLYFTLVLFIHEIGHIIMVIFFKWNIKKIIILPFGILLKFEDNLNKSLKEEFIIAIMGIVFQIVFVFFIHNKDIIFASNIILFFNILPIYPLDGSKIVNIILNKITNFKTSYFLTLIISYITIVILMAITIINRTLIVFIALIPLLFNLFNLILTKRQVFLKFLLERYLYDFGFKRLKKVKDLNEFKRDYYHFIYKNNNYIEEKEYLNSYFNS